ncbi:MAG: prolipoprotein diacylglyceryl transferase [Candidatus Cloacimonetes bacterium]|nr:prolipoprotein diacylglyceryl transferase [Candidatus Cloacimonadota bacterium]
MTIYGLIIAIAVCIGFYLSRCRALKLGISPPDIENLFLICTPFAVVGARLYHVLSEFSYYQKEPVAALCFWRGGWGIYGAIAGGILGIFLYTRFKKINFWKVLDLIAPSLVLGQAIGRLGNILNGELLPYAIYESILDFVIFLFLTFNFSLLTFHFSLYAILYGTGRFFLEFLRTEPEVFVGLKLNQLVSLLFIIFGVIFNRGVRIPNI